VGPAVVMVIARGAADAVQSQEDFHDHVEYLGMDGGQGGARGARTGARRTSVTGLAPARRTGRLVYGIIVTRYVDGVRAVGSGTVQALHSQPRSYGRPSGPRRSA